MRRSPACRRGARARVLWARGALCWRSGRWVLRLSGSVCGYKVSTAFHASPTRPGPPPLPTPPSAPWRARYGGAARRAPSCTHAVRGFPAGTPFSRSS